MEYTETDLGIAIMIAASALVTDFSDVESVEYNLPRIWMCERGKLRPRIYNRAEEIY